MMVLNTTTRLYNLRFVSKKANQLLRAFPGVSELSDDLVNDFKKDDYIKNLIDNGDLKLIKDSVEPVEPEDDL